MAGEKAPRRKSNLVPSAGARIYLDLAAERLALADLAPEGSAEARSLAQEAIGYVGFAVWRHIDRAWPTTDMPEREQWLSVLRFLSGTLMFQYPLETLTLALSELDRGIVPDGLKPTGTAQGGLPTPYKLFWMRTAVEIADEFVRQHDGLKADAEQFIEDETSVSPHTLRKWRAKLARLAPEHHPRTFRRYMPLPSQPGETYEARAARLAPLICALQTACQRAQNSAGKKHFLEKPDS